MCYSAQIEADYKKYVRTFGARISIREFAQLYWQRLQDSTIRIPKAVDAWFAAPQSDEELRIVELIDSFNQAQTEKLEQELFEQRTRLAKAERALQAKTTKSAAESKRIATNKIDATLRRIDDVQRKDLQERDARFFPSGYAPVIVMENGERVIKPMRYLCRPAGKPASYDKRYPGSYNARSDNLEGYWKGLFGRSHGLLVVNAFFENVRRAAMEHRELRDGEQDENVVLEFRPNTSECMLVACLWSHWQSPGEPDLFSFAAITTDPPPEVAAAGHNRCIIPIKPENVDAWLSPQPGDLAAQYAILDDRERPYYEHRLAA
ncbi:SOS response-associated peptidase family protein [Paraburkholderia phymatum]|uniref:SOS response-associated peptidase family protein n=1 Tax=Paraburkholderia phymatum TaxID=148447 RepID=UPI00316E8284